MKVRDIMTQPADDCAPETTVAIAGHLMADQAAACSRLSTCAGACWASSPIAICSWPRRYGSDAAQITVQEAMKRTVTTCSEDDELRAALDAMRRTAVRRLPVVDREATRSASVHR